MPKLLTRPRATSASPFEATAVDLFCGAGGLTYGLRSAGVRVSAGLDIDAECEYVYEQNNKGSRFIKRDVSNMQAGEIIDLYPANGYKILVGCAPCQSFSKYTRSHKSSTDRKWDLVRSFADLILEVLPDVVSMENVPELANHEVYSDFVRRVSAAGYSVSASIVFCPAYGIPQQRERLVLFASRLGEISIIPPTHAPEKYPTVKAALGKLEKLSAGGTAKSDDFHRCSKLSPLNLRRIQASRPGGTWRDWSEDLRAECHRVESGATYPSVYGRMEWGKPSPTITTQYFGFGNGRFGHPEQDRAISLREGALLQSFPPDYVLVEPGKKVRFATVGRMIGNAVPPLLGQAVGRTIMNHLSAHVQGAQNQPEQCQ